MPDHRPAEPRAATLERGGAAVLEEIDAVDGDACGPHIRCPKCGWRPRKQDRWACGCGHFWNTFDTGGVCPACLRQWAETQCLQCHEWSAHSDWYATD